MLSILPLLFLLALYSHFCEGTGDISAAKTVGAPWPQPESLVQTPTITYTVDAGAFVFQAPGASCDLLTQAFNRYYALTFGEEFVKENRQKLRPRQEAGVISSMPVTVHTPCQGKYPISGSDECYALTIDQNGTGLFANEVWGALRGLETFSQLVTKQSSGQFQVVHTMISDCPRFKHRGVMLDTSRHYLSVPTIIQNLEAMAQNKFNVFHWHIVDSTAFPYQSARFPQMSQKGAYNPQTHVYTQSDIKLIIEESRLRGIRVVPEFDTPGHTLSWGKGITNLLTPCYTGGHPDGTYGPVNPVPQTTYDFLKSFFTEVASLFPDYYLHLGGDEVSFGCWMTNPNVSHFMEKMNFTNYSQLEQYYMQQLLDIVVGLEKGSMIWQEVLDNGAIVRQDALVEVWKKGWEVEMAKVTQLGYQALLATCWYLNKISYGSDWTAFYTCEPYNFNGTLKQKNLVIGGEAAMWGEWVDDTNLISRLWPRASAVGERLWSPQNVNQTSTAEPRLAEHRCRMVRRGIPAEPITGPGFCEYY